MRGVEKSSLLSGDVVDVMFFDGDSFRMVEVKSCKSNDEDLRRGIYQCVKYREVKKSEHLPYEIDVQSILVTERELNSGLKERARILGIKHKCVFVNKKQMKNTKSLQPGYSPLSFFVGNIKSGRKCQCNTQNLCPNH